jgi:hypothetical protein
VYADVTLDPEEIRLGVLSLKCKAGPEDLRENPPRSAVGVVGGDVCSAWSFAKGNSVSVVCFDSSVDLRAAVGGLERCPTLWAGIGLIDCERGGTPGGFIGCVAERGKGRLVRCGDNVSMSDKANVVRVGVRDTVRSSNE